MTPTTPENKDPHKFDKKYAREHSELDCFKCMGNGWFFVAEPGVESEMIVAQAFRETIPGYHPGQPRICPYCYDPFHKPRRQTNKC